MRPILLAILLATIAAPATAAPTRQDARLARIAAGVEAARMRATVEKLVSFGTRHTLSSQTDPRRGIGAAVRWSEAEMKTLGLATLQTCDTVTGRRVPTPTKVCNALAIQRGTERPNDVVIITGHIDSRVTDVMDFTKDSPGANDDGSGTAAVLEAARVLSIHKFPGTIVYAVLSGEEQGLLGGKILADYAGRTRFATTGRCGSSPKDCAGRAAINCARRCAALAGRMTRPRAIYRASSTAWHSEFPRLASTCCQSGATTASAAAATTPNCSTPATPRSAYRSRSRIMSTSIRICEPKTASNSATLSTK